MSTDPLSSRRHFTECMDRLKEVQNTPRYHRAGPDHREIFAKLQEIENSLKTMPLLQAVETHLSQILKERADAVRKAIGFINSLGENTPPASASTSVESSLIIPVHERTSEEEDDSDTDAPPPPPFTPRLLISSDSETEEEPAPPPPSPAPSASSSSSEAPDPPPLASAAASASAPDLPPLPNHSFDRKCLVVPRNSPAFYAKKKSKRKHVPVRLRKLDAGMRTTSFRRQTTQRITPTDIQTMPPTELFNHFVLNRFEFRNLVIQIVTIRLYYPRSYRTFNTEEKRIMDLFSYVCLSITCAPSQLFYPSKLEPVLKEKPEIVGGLLRKLLDPQILKTTKKTKENYPLLPVILCTDPHFAQEDQFLKVVQDILGWRFTTAAYYAHGFTSDERDWCSFLLDAAVVSHFCNQKRIQAFSLLMNARFATPRKIQKLQELIRKKFDGVRAPGANLVGSPRKNLFLALYKLPHFANREAFLPLYQAAMEQKKKAYDPNLEHVLQQIEALHDIDSGNFGNAVRRCFEKNMFRRFFHRSNDAENVRAIQAAIEKILKNNPSH